MVKVRGRVSRASIQPKYEHSEASFTAESENDTFLTAKSAQQTFMSATENTFTGEEDTFQQDNAEDKTLLDSDRDNILADIPNVINSRVLRSAVKSGSQRCQSKSVMNLDKTPKPDLLQTSKLRRNGKKRRSAPGLAGRETSAKHRRPSTSLVITDSPLKVLESTPTDYAAAKRKHAGSEPARKQLMLNSSMLSLSPIEPAPVLRNKSKSDTNAAKDSATIVNAVEDNRKNDTVCLSAKKSSKKEQKLVSSSPAQKPALRSNIASSVADFASVGGLHRKPAASSSPIIKQHVTKPKLTIPSSPKFASTGRIKPIDYEPYTEREKKLADEMKQYRFRAQPIPKGVLKSSTVVPKVATKVAPAVTKSKSDVPMKPATKTGSSKPGSSNPAETKSKTKALGVVQGGIHKKKTDPHTPTFKLQDRIKQKKEMQEMFQQAQRLREAEKEAAEKAKREKLMRAALKGGVGGLPKAGTSTVSNEIKVTKPAPFSFYAKDQQRLMEKQEKIQQIYEEEKRKREFKAHPLPNLHAISGLPQKDVKPVTRPEPFNLATEDRQLAAQTTWSTTVDSISLETEEQYVFRARPMPDLSVAFVPEKSHKEPTQPMNFMLHTEVRAEERKPFEEHLKAREEELEEARRQRELEREEEEKREAARLRKSMVHVAQPIRHYKPTIIQHHAIAPTIPESPAFATKTRAQMRALAKAHAAILEEQDEALNDSGDTYVLDN